MPDEGPGKRPEVAAPGVGQVQRPEGYEAHWKLEKRPRRRVDPERPIGESLSEPSVGVLAREQARVHFNAQFHQDLQGPRASGCDAEAGGPVARDVRAGDIFQDPNRPGGFVPECLGRLSPDQGVIVGMTADEVAPRQDFPYQGRMLLGDPAQREKGRLGFVEIEKIQQTMGVRDDPRRV